MGGERGTRSRVRVEPFTNEEERIAALVAIREAGNRPEAIAEFARRNYGLAAHIAAHYHRRFPSVPLDDLCQEAFIGVLRAAEKFDVTRGASFAAYACRAAAYAVRGALQGSHFFGPYPVPPRVRGRIGKLRVLLASKGRDVDPLECARQVVIADSQSPTQHNVEESARTLLGTYMTRVVSIDAPLVEGEGMTLHDVTPSDEATPETQAMYGREAVALARDIVNRVQDLVYGEELLKNDWWRSSYFASLTSDIGAAEMAREAGVSRERVRQVLTRVDQHVSKRLGYSRHVVCAAFAVLEEGDASRA